MKFPFHTSFLSLLLLVSTVHARTWTNLQGKAIDAELVTKDSSHATLKLANGNEAKVPIASLCMIDQDFLKSASSTPTPTGSTESESTPLQAGPWPTSAGLNGDPEISVVEEAADQKKFIYESKHYRYTCDVRLAASVVKGFALLFEATYAYCQSVPLGMRSIKDGESKLEILLFEAYDDYIKNGGIPNSAGVFISGRNTVIVPLTSLGVKKVGSGYMLDRSQENTTLSHELTHQLTPSEYYNLGGWFSEGLAEYISSTPYRNGNFNIKNNEKAIVEMVTSHGKKGNGGRALGRDLKFNPLQKYFFQTYPEFLSNPQFNYGTGTLITYYYLNIEQNGNREAINKGLSAAREKKSSQEIITQILNGRSYEQMEKDISSAWKKKGINFEFAKAGSSFLDDSSKK